MSGKLRRNYPRVLAQIDGVQIRVNGRDGETLIKLVEKGSKGLRVYDFDGGPPFRLGAYIFDLRALGLSIRTEREEHAIGTHAVYYLHTAVTLISVSRGDDKKSGSA